MIAADLLVTTGVLCILAIPLALSLWALLDAAGRPEWAFALADRSRVVWVAACAAGIFVNIVGLAIAIFYLTRIRPQVAAAEEGRIA